MSPRTFNISSSDMLSTRSPLTRMTPASGFSSPRMSFKATDFPDPLAPSRNSVLAGGTEKLTSRSTTLSSKASETFSKTIAGASESTDWSVVAGISARSLVCRIAPGLRPVI